MHSGKFKMSISCTLNKAETLGIYNSPGRGMITGKNEFGALPDGIVFDMLFEYLDGSVQASVNLGQCSKRLNTMMSCAAIWGQKLIRRFGADISLYHPAFVSPVSTAAHPKQVYAATHSLEHRFSSADFCESHVVDMQGKVISSLLLSDSDLVVGDLGGNVRFLQQDDAPNLIPACHPNSSAVTCLTRLHEQAVVSGHADGSIMHFRDPDPMKVLPRHCRIDSIVGTEAGYLAVCSSNESTVRLLDSNHTYGELFMRRFDPDASPTCLAVPRSYSHVPPTVMLGHKDNRARIVDTRSGKNALILEMSDWCLCVSFSSQDPYVVKAADKAVNFFDLRKPDAPVDVKHKCKRLISKFSSDDKLRLASCGLDGTVKVSSLEKPDCPIVLYSDPDYILSLEFNRTTLACGGLSGKVHIFTF